MVKKLFSVVIAAGVLAPLYIFAEEDGIEEEVPCQDRGWSYCEVQNVGENCSVGTCNASLSSSGNCTIEAVFNESESEVVSCRVCSTEAIISDGCQGLGGNLRSPS